MNPVATAPPPEDSPVDSGKLFIPEELTPLFYTPSYGDLTAEQRLRYNQLHALYFNEQIMFFERALCCRILEALLREPWPDRVAAGLREFRDEERRHTEMFLRLNRLCAPRLYAGRDFHFVQVPAAWRVVLRWAVDHPVLFPLFFWLMLLQEERALFYSKRYIRQRETIEPSFVKAHRLHLADEVRHVAWDGELIDALWRRARPWRRRLNARLFAWMLEEFFGTPKRAQLRVVDELGRERPELRGRLPGMRRQLLALSKDEGYRTSLYSRQIIPKTFARFDESPEFRDLRMCGYHPQPEGL
ncbi:MAG TPA: diiron oxygenase [Thermoanaerobaculia bacterium]